MRMHLSETETGLFAEFMARMFEIMQVVGIVYNTFGIDLVVAHLDWQFEYIVHYISVSKGYTACH